MISAPLKPAPVQGGMFNFEDFEDNEEYDKWLSIEELQKKAKEFIMKEQNQKGKKKEVRMKKKWKYDFLCDFLWFLVMDLILLGSRRLYCFLLIITIWTYLFQIIQIKRKIIRLRKARQKQQFKAKILDKTLTIKCED